MIKPWPPPPDSASIQELVYAADVEGFIADGAPADEYDTEAGLLLEAIKDFPTADLIVTKLQPILEDIWRKSFSLDDAALAQRQPALEDLAQQIARFFGPEARPKVRGVTH